MLFSSKNLNDSFKISLREQFSSDDIMFTSLKHIVLRKIRWKLLFAAVRYSRREYKTLIKGLWKKNRDKRIALDVAGKKCEEKPRRLRATMKRRCEAVDKTNDCFAPQIVSVNLHNNKIVRIRENPYTERFLHYKNANFSNFAKLLQTENAYLAYLA